MSDLNNPFKIPLSVPDFTSPVPPHQPEGDESDTVRLPGRRQIVQPVPPPADHLYITYGSPVIEIASNGLDVYQWSLRGRNDAQGNHHYVIFHGVLLGYSSGQHSDHNPYAEHDDNGILSEYQERCSGCRWPETAVFEAIDPPQNDKKFMLYTLGRTLVPGEITRMRAVWAGSPSDVVDLAVIRHAGRDPYMTSPSRQALKQAALIVQGFAAPMIAWR